MSHQSSSRWSGLTGQAAEGWLLERLTRPSRLHGANGIAAGPDGRLYIAQVPGSQVSALDIDSGAIETISAMGGDIVAPDDLVFDDAGNIYVTEITENRVCRRTPDGKVEVVRHGVMVANPITWHAGRLIAGELKVGGRIMELALDGSEPRVIADNVPMANAFQVGPDGKLYFPVMGTNEIWRVDLDGGAPEIVAGDLGVPDSVKIDSKGRIITTQVMSGQVLRIDPVSGAREVLAQLEPGLDNCAFVGERLFVSNLGGSITELLASGETRSLVGHGLQWPLGLATDAGGETFVADGGFSYLLSADGELRTVANLFSGAGYVRCVCASGNAGEWLLTTGLGGVARWSPGGEVEWLGQGFDRLMGIAALADGTPVVAEYGTGRVLALSGGSSEVLASGLDRPMGVAVGDDGALYVAEAGAGRIVRLRGGRAEAVAEELGRPEGLATSRDALFVVDTAGKRVVRIVSSGKQTEAENGGARQKTIASNLPLGAPAGVSPKPIGPIGDMSGPMVNFAGIAVRGDGSLAVSADGEGSVLRVARAA